MAINTVDWPDGLPKCPQSFSETFKDSNVRSKTDFGSSKVRSRYTRSVRVVTIGYTRPRNEYDAWSDWFENVLGHGLVAFNYIHPYTGKVMKLRMIGMPQVNLTARAFRFQIKAEEVVS
ncbi:hypothetical protein [Vibrio breoganii]|uniref:hypothetical protein n=1 Tax=Vibrio breoganii TaxID=553239 RepID=UPI000C8328C4|nr:hypothetical protein [Vibrio breoganii]PMK30668.1 hypothetical protein BCU03_09640 [Vibrio breoganii]